MGGQDDSNSEGAAITDDTRSTYCKYIIRRGTGCMKGLMGRGRKRQRRVIHMTKQYEEGGWGGGLGKGATPVCPIGPFHPAGVLRLQL